MFSAIDVRLLDPAPWLSPADRARLLAPKLKALADRHRLEIVLLLAEQPRTVKELQEATGLSPTLVSHQLKPLRDQDPVSYTHLRAHETRHDLVCRLLLE